jgi:hypothetical protein
MPYLLGGVFILVVFFLIAHVSFKSALNSCNMAKDLKEIRILLMKAENEDK